LAGLNFAQGLQGRKLGCMAHTFEPDRTKSPADKLLGLDDFAEPDDQGLSLDELGRAYAALLRKGADPYPEPEKDTQFGSGPGAAPIASRPGVAFQPAEGEPLPVDRGHDDACPLTPKSILEAILFVGHPANEPLAAERIAALMRGVHSSEIDELVEELNRDYEAAGCPYTIASVDLGYQLTLRPQFASLRDAFYGRIREACLSQSAIDVLAIVAYQQPVTQHQIDLARGKPSTSIVTQLVRRDLLTVQRSADSKCKPTFRTTDRFLDLFDLDQLADLPRSHDVEREL
jgi:segregation and condensation protein B